MNTLLGRCLRLLALALILLIFLLTFPAHASSHHRSQSVGRLQAAQRIETLGNHYLVNDQFDKALPLIQRAIQLNPKEAGYWQDLGVCLSQMNRKTQAISAYRTADRLKPNYWLTLNNLAITLNAVGKHDEAVAVARRAIKAAGSGDQDTVDTMNKIIHQ